MKVQDCWYSKVCKKYETPECNDMCVRFTEMLHMMKYSGIPQSRFKSQSLNVVKDDYNSYLKLNEIKANIKDFVQSGKILFII